MPSRLEVEAVLVESESEESDDAASREESDEVLMVVVVVSVGRLNAVAIV
jgi:hypothetical protein